MSLSGKITAIAALLIAAGSMLRPVCANTAAAGKTTKTPGAIPNTATLAYAPRAAKSPEALLHEQLDTEKERHQKVGQDSADDAMRLAAEEADKVRQEAEEEIEGAKQTAQGYAQQEMVAAIEAESRRRQLAIRCLRQAEARQHLALAEQRTHSLDQSAQTLAKEMAKPPAASGFGISPHGSNLYVRNYVHAETPADSPR